METRNNQEDYIKIRCSDFGLVQRKYMLSQEEIDMMPIDIIKRNIAIEIGQYLLDQGILGFEQEDNTLIASLYVVRHPKGAQKINGDENS